MRALLVHVAHEIAGAARIRHSLRPLISGGRKNYWQASGAMRRENAKLHLLSIRAKRLVRWNSTKAEAIHVASVRRVCIPHPEEPRAAWRLEG
jgi:hypothetical protein